MKGLRTFSALIAASLVASVTSVAYADGAPAADETIALPGLSQPSDILIDRWGVPHIYAANDSDAFFVQGFNAARDRLFQIDLWRRRGLGQLAEVFGPAYIEQDKSTRMFLYRGDMTTEWKRYGPDAKPAATRFAAGVNAYIAWLAVHPDRMPYEFRKIGYWPAKWSADDVVRIRSHGLTRNLTSEVARARVACKSSLDADSVRFGLQLPWKPAMPAGLDPCFPDDVLKVFSLATQSVRVTKESLKSADASTTMIAATDNPEEVTEGSNNWVIAPSKSATGRAIMPNDPHRAYAAPSLRYIQQISTPTLDIIGGGEPSAPGISIGHNGSIAYGLTIFNIDQEDLYVYELNPSNSREYRYKGKWEPMRVVRETINVRDAAPVTADLLFTRHGPVIYTEESKHRAFAVRSAWLSPGMLPYFDSMRYMRAKNYAQFNAALATWGAPTVNQVYADKDGNIGWVPSGLAPIRPNWDGLMPVSGDGRYEWTGFWPRAAMPSTYNPAQGYFTTSNEMNLPADYPYRERKLGFEWTNGSRHQRIDEVLKSLPKVSIEDSERLQNDDVSIPARRLVALLAPLDSDDQDTRAALTLLKGWDAHMGADSAQAALEEVWLSRHLGRAFKSAVLPKNAASAFGAPDTAVMLDSLEHPEARFGADAQSKRDAVLLSSLHDAYAEMVRLQGNDASRWKWGELQTNLNAHPLADAVDADMRAKLNVGPIGKGGSAYTPNQSTYRASDFRETNGPSFRVVVDVGNWDDSRAVNLPGESGDPDNPHYRDLAQMWLKGQYFPLLYSSVAVEAATEKRVHLVPAAP
ncbi:Penicillin acylase (Penicillin amidase) [Candidatus Burkholderia verschuerenii]|uniref:Penicillin acylase (Penicillin amidase) n=1 Tax=Candidatus Burkholderia verschuerenii TaxID=242163 RepID=A0A0L0M9W7_9BURK|nr:penicillin acylase family protein [Candidatus Burkholderia verschuerenii]KND59076.1 Penicillin acylase (Penicillin amidase) [Candidatus Burkholderia verschuerenii]